MSATATQPIQTDTTTWQIDPAHTSVQFEVKHMMFAKVRGRFDAVEGMIELGADELTDASRVDAVIDASSVDTGQAQRDDHLRSADFFDVERFPEIRFESRTVRRLEKGRLSVTGNLTIHGNTREVVLDVSESGRGRDPWGNERIGFSAKTTIDRRDFGLTWNQGLETGGILVGHSVGIELEIQAVRQAD